MPGKIVDEGVVVAVCHVIGVLHTDDLGNLPAFRQLRGIDIAQAKMSDQSLRLQLCQHAKRFCDRTLRPGCTLILAWVSLEGTVPRRGAFFQGQMLPSQSSSVGPQCLLRACRRGGLHTRRFSTLKHGKV